METICNCHSVRNSTQERLSFTFCWCGWFFDRSTLIEVSFPSSIIIDTFIKSFRLPIRFSHSRKFGRAITAFKWAHFDCLSVNWVLLSDKLTLKNKITTTTRLSYEEGHLYKNERFQQWPSILAKFFVIMMNKFPAEENT